MKKLLSLLLCTIVSLFAVDYKITAPSQPNDQEKTAVEELTAYLAKRIDGTLTIGGKSGIVFHVGNTDLAKQNHLLSSDLKDEQWVIKSFENNVVLNGGGSRGVLYAVYHFLEDECDIHWWSETEEYIPSPSSLALPTLDKTGRPFFRYRNIYRGLRPTEARLRFMVRVRQNNDNLDSNITIPKHLGGSFMYGPPAHAHTFDSYIPFKEYQKTHPEYFSLVEGKRLGGLLAGQLCLTNPALKDIFVKKLRAYIEQGKANAKKLSIPEPLIYDISQNDNRNPCECDACRQAAEKYNQSGLYINFINGIAEEIAKDYPEIYISTLAYHYTETPPKGGITVRDNVIVKLTNSRTNKAASLLDKQNEYFKNVVEQWSKICKNLLIWEYAITFTKPFTGMPMASELYYGDMFRHYATNNVLGLFIEHQYPEKADMFEYKFFLEAKLCEDPFQNVQKLSKLFLDKYYGDAAPFIRQYRLTIDDAAKKANAQLRWTRTLEAFDFLTEDVILECQKLFDYAVNAVKDNQLLLQRVMRARNGLDRLTCIRTSGLIYHGPKTPSKSKLDGAVAYKRMETYWTAWCNRYEDHKNWKEPIIDVLNQFRFYYNPIPAPKQFEGRNYYEFIATCSARGDYDFKNIWAAEEADSPVGRGFRIKVDGDHHYDMPFAIGVYDNAKKQVIAYEQFDKIPDYRGYNWFGFSKPVVIPADGILYITRNWTIQLHFNGMKEIIGKPFEIYVSARHQGKQFHPYQGTGGDRIIVDRIILVEPQMGK